MSLPIIIYDIEYIENADRRLYKLMDVVINAQYIVSRRQRVLTIFLLLLQEWYMNLLLLEKLDNMQVKKSAVNGKKIQWKFIYMQEINRLTT